MADTGKMTLTDIRAEVSRRSKQVEDLKERLEKLGREILDILADIDESEGLTPPRRRRGRRPAGESLLAPAPAGEGTAEDAAVGSALEAALAKEGVDRAPEPEATTIPAAEPAPLPEPAPKKEKGPSIVDVAVEILKGWGGPMKPAELAAKIEERGVVSGNTQQVLLMAAGRRSRIGKTEDGSIALMPEES